MAKFIPDPPHSLDAQSVALLRVNRGRTKPGRETNNGSVAKGGTKVADAVGVSGSSL